MGEVAVVAGKLGQQVGDGGPAAASTSRAGEGIEVAEGARLLVAELAETMAALAPGGDLDDYEDAIRTLVRDTAGSDSLRWELLAYHAHLATLRRFFECPEHAAALLDEDGEPTATLVLFEKPPGLFG